MADEAFRAVFLRVHPTGKMVLSLTTVADGHEPRYAQLVADALGVPALDIKVVPADTDRFGVGHGNNESPSEGTATAVTSAAGKIRDKAQQLAGMALEAPAGGPDLGRRCILGGTRRHRGQDDRRPGAVRARDRRAPAPSRGRARRSDRLPRLAAR